MGLYILLLVLLIIVCMDKVSSNPSGQKEKNLNKNDSVTLKGLAAFLVILGHLYLWTSYESSASYISVIISLIFKQFGGIGVLIFFFLSGFGIQERYGNNEIKKEFLYKRFINVYCPYLGIKAIFLIAEIVLKQLNLSQLFRRIFSIILIEEWFVLVILLEYIIYFISRRIGKWWIAFLFVFNGILSVVFIICGYEDRYYNSMWVFLFGVLFSCASYHFKFLIDKHPIILSGISFLLFVGSGFIFQKYKGEVFADLFKPISGIGLCICLVILLKYLVFESRVLKWAGENSFNLYIIHMSLYALMNDLGCFNPYIFLILLILLSIFFKRTKVILELMGNRHEFCKKNG